MALSKFTKEQVQKNIVESSSNEAQPVIACGSGTSLDKQSNSCVVVENNKNDGKNGNIPIVVPSKLVSPPATDIICSTPTGQFTELYYRQKNFVSRLFCGSLCKADVLGKFRYTGNCVADIYIEAGIRDEIKNIKPLAVTPSGYLFAEKGLPSACDGNVHFNGIMFKQLNPGQVVIFELEPENYGVEGTYAMTIGAYTGCIKDGGKEIQVTNSLLVGFSNDYFNDINSYWIKIV